MSHTNSRYKTEEIAPIDSSFCNKFYPCAPIVRLVIFSLKSAPKVLILIENTNILAIYDWSQIITWSVTGHIIRVTGHTNL